MFVTCTPVSFIYNLLLFCSYYYWLRLGLTLTHSSEHTHTVNTHLEEWAAIYAATHGEQLGVRCLAQGHLSHGIEVY